MNSRARILSAALALFNAHGTAQVSTNHIAQAAQVSPGNLYYHFRNKQEIIRTLCEQLFTRTGEMFAPASDQPPTLQEIQGWVRENFAVTWEYAFVFRELPALLRQDALLAATYATVRRRGYDGFRELVGALAAVGLLLPLDEATTAQLADLLWLLSEQWLTALELQGEPASTANMQRGVDLMMMMLAPYLCAPPAAPP